MNMAYGFGLLAALSWGMAIYFKILAMREAAKMKQIHKGDPAFYKALEDSLDALINAAGSTPRRAKSTYRVLAMIVVGAVFAALGVSTLMRM